jgi:hypothetical protein
VNVEIDIEHTDLDHDEGEDVPSTMVQMSIVTPDGMRYAGTVFCEGQANQDQLSEMMCKACEGAGATHSPELGKTILNRIRG